MREYEVNTRVTERGSHAFTLKGVSMYHRKEPFTISDIIYEVLEQTWPYRKYNVNQVGRTLRIVDYQLNGNPSFVESCYLRMNFCPNCGHKYEVNTIQEGWK